MIYKRKFIWLSYFGLIFNRINAEEYVITLKAPKTLHKLLAVKVGSRSLQQILDSKIKHKFSFGKFEAITVDVSPLVVNMITDSQLVSHVSLNEEYNLLDSDLDGLEVGHNVRYVYQQPKNLEYRSYKEFMEDKTKDGEKDLENSWKKYVEETDSTEFQSDNDRNSSSRLDGSADLGEHLYKPKDFEQDGSEQDGSEHDDPEHDWPEHDWPEHDEPEHDGPEHDGPEHDWPEHDGPEHDWPEHDEPEHDEPEHDGPEHDGPEHDGPEHDSPEKNDPEKIEPSDPSEPSEPNKPSEPSETSKLEPSESISKGQSSTNIGIIKPTETICPDPPNKPLNPIDPIIPVTPSAPNDNDEDDEDGNENDDDNDDESGNNPLYATQQEAPRHLARNCRRTGLPYDTTGKNEYTFNYYYDSEHLGESVNVYILDSGIYKLHPEFEGRALFGIDTTNEGPGDLNGHGTHVAGLVGSKSYGSAKKATLYEVKVMTVDGRGSTSNIIAGVEFAVKHCQQSGKKCVVNMSLGGLSFGHSALDSAVEAAIEEGVVFVVAAGNSKERACWYSPAKVKTAITVGAFDDRSDIIASFSNYGKCVDIFAPGVAVISLSNSPYNDIRVLNGTSMSAPITSGVVAVLLDQGVHADDVKNYLIDLSTKGIFHKRRLVSSRTPDRTLFNGISKDDDMYDLDQFPFEDEDVYVKFIGNDFKKVQGPSLFRKVLKSTLSKVI